MINQVYIDDKKVKDILTYIAGMRHAEQIKMMFLCSLNGMRSINFCYLQIKDVYNDDLNVKDVICLDENKYRVQNNRCSGCLNAGINEPSRAI